jgi:hypothetical protein
MPTILFINGWRFFFYSNEMNEPIHIHFQKGEKEGKFWLLRNEFEVKEAFTFKMNSKEKREVKKIIFEYF